MSILGKNLSAYVKFARTGMILIVLMGLIRFFVGISGVPYERATHLVSMTSLTLLLFVIYGHIAAARGFGTYRHLLPTAAALSISMYGFIILAILTEGVSGLHGYFHFHTIQNMAGTLPSASHVMTLGNEMGHIGGQILAWIPVTFLGWGLASLGFLLSPFLAFLRNAFLLVAGFGVFRLVVGAMGVPQVIGTWISSITLLAMILAIYYGYSAPSHGFHRYWQVIPMGFLISTALNLVVIAGMLSASNFMIANYFNPEGVSINQHILAHLVGSIVGTIPFALLVGIGFAAARRKPALKSQPAT